jgi:deoxyribonuclease-4
MPLLGAHESINGGPHKALYRAEKKGFEVIQIFTRHRLRWSARDLTKEEIVLFEKASRDTGVVPVAIHGSYLLNPASPEKDSRKKTIELLINEAKWTSRLDIPYLVIHPGSHMGAGEKKGMEHVAETVDKVFETVSNIKVKILLETTAGQGSSLGYRFDQLKTIIDKSSYSSKIGICFDTCHAFAAGYNFSNKEGYRQLFENFDNIIGLEKLKIFHINDSKAESGSFTDRHAHPGQGCIGLEGLSFFLRDERFVYHPFIMETSKELDEDGIEMDVKNLKLLKHLSGRGKTG